jgi:hypothetical protein
MDANLHPRVAGLLVQLRHVGDEVTGQYDAHSPVSAFTSQEMARRKAGGRLNRLFAPPLAASKTGEQRESPGRRAFLRGGASGR